MRSSLGPERGNERSKLGSIEEAGFVALALVQSIERLDERREWKMGRATLETTTPEDMGPPGFDLPRELAEKPGLAHARLAREQQSGMLGAASKRVVKFGELCRPVQRTSTAGVRRPRSGAYAQAAERVRAIRAGSKMRGRGHRE